MPNYTSIWISLSSRFIPRLWLRFGQLKSAETSHLVFFRFFLVRSTMGNCLGKKATDRKKRLKQATSIVSASAALKLHCHDQVSPISTSISIQTQPPTICSPVLELNQSSSLSNTDEKCDHEVMQDDLTSLLATLHETFTSLSTSSSVSSAPSLSPWKKFKADPTETDTREDHQGSSITLLVRSQDALMGHRFSINNDDDDQQVPLSLLPLSRSGRSSTSFASLDLYFKIYFFQTHRTVHLHHHYPSLPSRHFLAVPHRSHPKINWFSPPRLHRRFSRFPRHWSLMIALVPRTIPIRSISIVLGRRKPSPFSSQWLPRVLHKICFSTTSTKSSLFIRAISYDRLSITLSNSKAFESIGDPKGSWSNTNNSTAFHWSKWSEVMTCRWSEQLLGLWISLICPRWPSTMNTSWSTWQNTRVGTNYNRWSVLPIIFRISLILSPDVRTVHRYCPVRNSPDGYTRSFSST